MEGTFRQIVIRNKMTFYWATTHLLPASAVGKSNYTLLYHTYGVPRPLLSCVGVDSEDLGLRHLSRLSPNCVAQLKEIKNPLAKYCRFL